MNGYNKIILGVMWLFFFLLLYFAVFGEKGLVRVNQLAIERDETKAVNTSIANENERLTKEKTALQDDIKTIERAARVQLDLVREDEILYKFSTESEK